MNKRITSVLIGISFVLSVLVSGCSNNSVAKEPKPVMSTNKVDENTIIRTEETTKYNEEEVAKEKDKSSVVQKEILTDVIGKYVESLGCKIQMNSIGSYWTVLPKDFNEIKNGFEIGNFLKERNQKSINNGFDFSQYMGKEIAYVTCGLEKGGYSAGELIAFLSDGKIVGVWTFEGNNENSDHILLTSHLEHN